MFGSLCSDNSLLSGTEGFDKKQAGEHFVDGSGMVTTKWWRWAGGKGWKTSPSAVGSTMIRDGLIGGEKTILVFLYFFVFCICTSCICVLVHLCICVFNWQCSGGGLIDRIDWRGENYLRICVFVYIFFV